MHLVFRLALQSHTHTRAHFAFTSFAQQRMVIFISSARTVATANGNKFKVYHVMWLVAVWSFVCCCCLFFFRLLCCSFYSSGNLCMSFTRTQTHCRHNSLNLHFMDICNGCGRITGCFKFMWIFFLNILVAVERMASILKIFLSFRNFFYFKFLLVPSTCLAAINPTELAATETDTHHIICILYLQRIQFQERRRTAYKS